MRILKPLYIILLIGLLAVLTACAQEQSKQVTPKMAPAEVCQYVNQALPDDYEPINNSKILRYKYRYTALSAVYSANINVPEDEFERTLLESYNRLSPAARPIFIQRIREDPELRQFADRLDTLSTSPLPSGAWLVKVRVIGEPQVLREGNWISTAVYESVNYTENYFFSETTGAVRK